MSTKSFIFLIIGILVIGGGLGGAFAAGVNVGKNSVPESTSENGALTPATTLQPFNFDGGALPPGVQVFSSGDVTMGSAPAFSFAAPGGAITSGPGGSASVGAMPTALFGTVESIDGNIVTIRTPQGLIKVTVGEETTIRKNVDVPVGDLEIGYSVSAFGQRGENGGVDAMSISVVDEEFAPVTIQR